MLDRSSRAAVLGDNGGPPLDDDGPPWGDGDPYIYFRWVETHAAAWKKVSPEVALRRAEKAEALGLTYEEYTLEILERGRYLQEGDRERIAAIRSARSGRA